MKIKVCGVQISLIVLIISSLLCFFGCARIDYVKVPTPTQYSNWTDKDQKKADKMKGVRYYLPRPYLHLKQSVPVAQRVAFISFRYDKSRSAYVLELPADPPTWLSRVAPKKISISQALAAVIAKPKEKAQVEAELQSETVEDDGKAADSKKPAGEAPPSTLKSTTGFINQTDPVTKLSDKMDVVYLPDTEEQYVIKPRIGLGRADIETKLRNGWAAETFSMNVDNSNVIPYIIRQVENASETAAGIATTWLPVAVGLPPGTSPATLLDLMNVQPGQAAAELESAKIDEKEKTIAENFLGQVLLFKIAEVRIAQPGLYPILKPREVKQWLKYDGVVLGTDPQDSFEQFLVNAKVPWIRPDMAFIPCPPFTMVGFNTTIDVFLTSATDRSVMSVSSKGGQGGSNIITEVDVTDEINDIRKALVKKKSALAGDANLINEQSIIVTENTSHNGIIISIEAPKPITFSSNQNAIESWVKTIFGLDSDSKDVAAKIVESGKQVEITINLPILVLADKVKEVK